MKIPSQREERIKHIRNYGIQINVRVEWSKHEGQHSLYPCGIGFQRDSVVQYLNIV